MICMLSGDISSNTKKVSVTAVFKIGFYKVM